MVQQVNPPNGARDRFETLRRELDAAARKSKESQRAVVELSRRYAALPSDEKRAVDDRLAEWVVSDDPGLRFDALALIGDHCIRSAVPALRELARRLESESGPSAPYELVKVNRLLRHL